MELKTEALYMEEKKGPAITQVTFDETMAEKVKDVRNEYILQVTGTVQLRKDATLRWQLVKLKCMQKML